MIQRLSFSFSFICLGLMAFATTAQAQTASTYPTKPVKVVVGFAPGGAADYVARTISESLGKSLGQAVIIENKAGSPDQFASFLTEDAKFWVKLVKSAGVKLD
jgi:tripartite-type tricarboxylate transporter receptor subunit TctC